MFKYFKFILAGAIMLITGLFSIGAEAQEVSDTEITYGSEYIFNTASTSRIFTVSLSPSKFVTVYQDGGASINQGTAIIGKVSGNAITYGSEYVFNTANTDYLSVTALADNKFAVVYKDISNSNYGTVVIGEVSGNAITYGSEYVFNTANTDYLSVVALSDSKLAIAYQNNIAGLKQGKVVIAEVNGTSVNFGSTYTFNTSITNYTSLNAFFSDKILITYQDGGNASYGTAIIGTVSGQAVDLGLEYVFNRSVTSHISSIILLDNRFRITYQDKGGNLNYGTAIVGDIIGNVITYGSEYIFNTGATSYVSADILSENKMIISFQGNSGLNYGKAVIGKVPDNTINFGSKYVFNPTSTGGNSVTRLSDSKFVIAYQDGAANLNYGTAIIGDIPVEIVIEPEPEPEPEAPPTPEAPADEAEIDIKDGDLIKNSSAFGIAKFDIYIIKINNNKKFKRLILSPHVFESYEHLNWSDVKDVDLVTINAYTTSNLVRAVGDDRVYKLTANGDTGIKELASQGYDSDSIYEVNQTDSDAYIIDL